MGFDLSSVLKDVSKLDTGGQNSGREQIEYIDITELYSDPKNFYSLEGIDELAANIELCGLQQPIRVRPEDGLGYRIVSGHRRFSAIKKLFPKSPAKWGEVPCIVEREQGSEALRELRLIYANSDTRKMTSADLAKQAERVEALLYQLKEEGYEFPGRMRDHVAEACKISASKLARLKVIREKLVPEYSEAYACNKINESSAYALAQMPPEFQRRMAKTFKELPNVYALDDLRGAWEKGNRWEPEMNCPDGKACRHADAFLRHDADRRSSMCKGKRCCLECSDATTEYYSCPYMCSKAAAQRKLSKSEREQKKEEQRLKAQEELKRKTAKSAARIVAAADAAGLGAKEKIPCNLSYGGETLKDIREYAEGNFGDNYLYSDSYDFTASSVAKAAKTLGCSADYLCGLTDELHPTAVSNLDTGLQWQTGEPTKKGWYLADFSGGGYNCVNIDPGGADPNFWEYEALSEINRWLLIEEVE